MRAYVFTDEALVKHAGRFVWLSIDTEKAQNAPFLEKFPISALPTILVIDPDGEEVAFKWLGSVNVHQLEKLLDDAEQAVKAASSSPAEAALARADRLYGEGKYAEAARAYQAALELGGPKWRRQPRAMESWIFSLQSAEDYKGCIALARREAPGMMRGSSFANVSVTGLMCALELEDADAKAARKELEPLVREALTLDGLLADDRSSLYGLLVELELERGNTAAAKKLAQEWIAFLEAEAAAAPTPEARAAFDPHRVQAALTLGDPARAVAALQQSEKDFPQDFNPPARLAVLYRELGKFPEALAATDRALERVYGPRRMRVLSERASIYERMGDKAKARQTLEEAIRFGESLPAGQKSEGMLSRLKSQLAKLK